MRSYLHKSLVLVLLILVLSSYAGLFYSTRPPQGYTGAAGIYCTNCHSGNPLNNAGGSVAAPGLPDTNYIAGTTYSFSIFCSHSIPDRKRFGFSIVALNKQGLATGSFSSSNPNAASNGTELSHFNALTLSTAVASYSYDGLSWTAPAVPQPADSVINFFWVGNAADGSGSSAGDFIYAASKTVSLLLSYTFSGNGNWSDPVNWSNNLVPPAIIKGHALIVIDPPISGECVLDIPQQIGKGTTLLVKTGKRFRVAGNLIINQ